MFKVRGKVEIQLMYQDLHILGNYVWPPEHPTFRSTSTYVSMGKESWEPPSHSTWQVLGMGRLQWGNYVNYLSEWERIHSVAWDTRRYLVGK